MESKFLEEAFRAFGRFKQRMEFNLTVKVKLDAILKAFLTKGFHYP
jgi:hypothetical protein